MTVVSGSGHHSRTDPSNRQPLSRVERVASQLARAVNAVDRVAEEEEDEDLVAAVLNALGPDSVELLLLLSDAVREELAEA